MMLISGILIGYVVCTWIAFHKVNKLISTLQFRENEAKQTYFKIRTKDTSPSREVYKPYVINDKSMLEEILNKESEFVE